MKLNYSLYFQPCQYYKNVPFLLYLFISSTQAWILAHLFCDIMLGMVSENTTSFFQIDFEAILTLALIVASVTIALVALLQTKQIQRKQFTTSVIKEIIEWAEGITIFISKQIVSDRSTSTVILRDAAERLKELNVLAAKGIYMESLVSGIFPNNAVLLADIKNLGKLIEQHTGVVSIVVTAEDNKQVGLMGILEEWLRDEEKSAVKVRDAAIKLIKFVAPIYIKFKWVTI